MVSLSKSLLTDLLNFPSCLTSSLQPAMNPKKIMAILPKWIPSATLFGASAGAAMCYATDWKTVLQYMPYYGGKFKTEEES